MTSLHGPTMNEIVLFGEIRTATTTFNPCLKRFHRIWHLFKNTHRISISPRGLTIRFHAHLIPIPVGIPIPTAALLNPTALSITTHRLPAGIWPIVTVLRRGNTPLRCWQPYWRCRCSILHRSECTASHSTGLESTSPHHLHRKKNKTIGVTAKCCRYINS